MSTVRVREETGPYKERLEPDGWVRLTLLQTLLLAKRAYRIVQRGLPLEAAKKLWMERLYLDSTYPKEAEPIVAKLKPEELKAKICNLASLWEEFQQAGIAGKKSYDSDEVMDWLYEKLMAPEVVEDYFIDREFAKETQEKWQQAQGTRLATMPRPFRLTDKRLSLEELVEEELSEERGSDGGSGDKGLGDLPV